MKAFKEALAKLDENEIVEINNNGSGWVSYCYPSSITGDNGRREVFEFDSINNFTEKVMKGRYWE